MCRSWKTLLALVILLLAGSPVTYAQDYQVRHYTLDDGLPSSHVQDVTQDDTGHMWFATRTGIACYDGADWLVFNLTHGLTWTDTFDLEWDADGVLWSVGSVHPFRVFSFEDGRWNALPDPVGLHPDARVTAFAVVGRGAQKRAVIGTDRGLLLGDRSGWRLLSAADGLPSSQVTAFAATRDGLMVGTSGGLAELRGQAIDARINERLPEGLREVLGLTAEEGAAKTARLWVLGRNWIGYMENTGNLEDGGLSDGGLSHSGLSDRGLTVLTTDLPWPSFASRTRGVAAADRRGGLYFGAAGLFFHFHPERGFQSIGRRNGLLSDGVTSLFLDREDVLWIGSRRGLSKVPHRRFMTYNRRHGLFDDEVTAVLERSAGDFVLAHPRGVSFLEGSEVRTLDIARLLPIRHRTPDRIRDLAEDGQGNLWIPTYGLVRVDPSGGLKWFGDNAGLKGAVDAVLATDEGVWAATSDGLFVLRDTRFQPASAGLPRMVIRRISRGSGTEILLAADKGLFQLSGQDWRQWSCRETGGCNSVFAAYPRADGSFWAGTSAGLYRTAGDSLVEETSPDIDSPIYFIVKDKEQRAWFGIDNGVMRWNGTDLEHFTVRAGLAGRETNRAAGLVDSSGRVWIGTERGANLYTDEPFAPARAPPTLVLTELEAGGRSSSLAEPRRLAFDANDVIFRFRAISFVDEDRLRVSWRLEGSDDGWSEPETFPHQEIRFFNLPPGQYFLHVKALNSDGLESAVASSARIVVARPYWQQPWFFLAVGALVAAGLYFVQSLVAHKRYSRRLEIEVEDRVAQLRRFEAELAKSQKLEAVGLLAGGIAHDFNNFLTVLNGNLSLLALPGRSETERAEDIADAQAAILRAIKLTQQLLTFSRGGAPVRKAASIFEVVAESTSFVLSGSNVRCEVDLPDDLNVVEIDAGQIHQLLNNLLINAMQAMPDGGTVRIVGRNVEEFPADLQDPTATSPLGELTHDRYVAIDVIDQGVGIPPENLGRIFDPYFTTRKEGRGLGLASSYSIAKRHDGLLTVESKPGRGARFTLYLPASKATVPVDVTPHGEPAAGSGRVLIMDDEESVRRVTGAIVEDLGYEVGFAADGEEAIALYQRARLDGRPFDVVIMDLTIPGGMGGREAVRRLLVVDPAVHAIVVSGYSNDPVMASYHEYGFRGRLTKPFRTVDLAQLLGEAVATGGRAKTFF